MRGRPDYLTKGTCSGTVEIGLTMRRRKTIVDVAEECGLSQATVARVLNGQKNIQVKGNTRERVLSAAKKIGYRRNALAASLRRQETNTIAISIADITNPFFPELIKAIQDTMRQYGYSVIQLNNEWNPDIEQEHFQYMIQTCVDGAIISPSHPTTNLEPLGIIPFVLLTNSADFPTYDTVGNDSKEGMNLALERLYELGHRQIALFVGGSMKSGSSWRLEVFNNFYERKGMEAPTNMHVDCEFSINSVISFEKAKNAMEKFLAGSNLPTAVFASNDILGLATLQVANDKGINVPDQLSVVGMDGIFSGEVSYPPLTTVNKNRAEIGRMAALTLIEKIKQPNGWEAKKLMLPCNLIERGSTGRA